VSRVKVDDETLARAVEWRDAETRLALIESDRHGVRLIIRRDEERAYEQALRERAAREEAPE
jgi:hypothetical protein